MMEDARRAMEAIMTKQEVWDLVQLVGNAIHEHGNVPEALSAVLYAMVRLEFKGQILPGEVAHSILDDILYVRDAIILAHETGNLHGLESDQHGPVCKGCGLRLKTGGAKA